MDVAAVLDPPLVSIQFRVILYKFPVQFNFDSAHHYFSARKYFSVIEKRWMFLVSSIALLCLFALDILEERRLAFMV